MPKLSLTQTSKFLSFVLRHRPEEIGITLDSQGWVPVEELLGACERHGRPISHELLQTVISNCDKQRFALSDDGQRIRASQGHSVTVELGYQPQHPPEILYHGTATRNLPSIEQHGLLKGKRHHVHLSGDAVTALNVGRRYGTPVVLLIRSAAMAADGQAFFRSANGVWLTEHVSPKYLCIPQEPSG